MIVDEDDENVQKEEEVRFDFTIQDSNVVHGQEQIQLE